MRKTGFVAAILLVVMMEDGIGGDGVVVDGKVGEGRRWRGRGNRVFINNTVRDELRHLSRTTVSGS
jgi:hypothetical protein